MTKDQQDHERWAKTLFDLGADWASYGLETGRAALQTSSATLAESARVLGRIAERIRAGSTRRGGDLVRQPK